MVFGIGGLGEEWWVGKPTSAYKSENKDTGEQLNSLVSLLIFLRVLLKCPLLFSVGHVESEPSLNRG